MKYIRLREHGEDSKKPQDKWRDPNNQYERHELLEWENSGHNVGFVCGSDDICVLDIDNPVRVDALGVRPYDTFAVKTGSGGYHLYYKIKDAKKVIFFDEDNTHLGELQCTGQYVVSHGCTHPNGRKYVALNPDTPILEVTYDEILDLFRGKCRITGEKKKQEPVFREFRVSKDDPLSKVAVEDVWLATVTEERGDQLFCIHPRHGSTTGHNLIIHPGKNVWQCRRCNSGGGVAMAIAVKYGIIDCTEALPGALRGDKFKEVLEVAREKGLIKGPVQVEITKRRIVIDE